LKETKKELKATASPELIKNAKHKLSEDEQMGEPDKVAGESATSGDPKL
jgi:hypothetical protein